MYIQGDPYVQAFTKESHIKNGHALPTFQKDAHTKAVVSEENKTPNHGLWHEMQKNHCPLPLNITVQKSPRGKASNRHHTLQTIVKITFHHNHPIDSAHVLGFRPVSENTKKEYIHLFSLGHSASSAHHH